MKQHNAVIVGLALLVSGCATVFSGATQPVTFKSVPEGATITIADKTGATVHSGTTPATVRLERGAGYFKPQRYTVTVAMNGYQSRTVDVQGSLNGWYAGNILLGGIIGMLIVDPLTGAMYTLQPNDIETTLQSGGVTVTNGDRVLTVMLAKDVPAESWQYACPLAAN